MIDRSGDIAFRIVLFVGLILASFLVPVWVAFILALVPVFVYRHYVEFLVIAVLLDAVYWIPGDERAVLGAILYTLLAIGLYLLVRYLKRYLYVYHRS